jgi:preprotein translocase subunit Sss1
MAAALFRARRPPLDSPAYYKRYILEEYRPPGRIKPWFPAIHLGKVKKPTWEEWLAAVSAGGSKGKIVLTCTTCNITNNTTSVNDLRGQGMSCLCGGSGILKQHWYYDAVIAKPYTPPGATTPWYPAIHPDKEDSDKVKVKKPTWEVWFAAVSAGGSKGKIVLTCTTCNITNDTTSVGNLQGGGGMSCLCGGSGILKQRWYYDAVIAKPYTPPGATTPWYPAFHPDKDSDKAKVKKPTWEEWLAAVRDGGAFGKIVLTCTTCNITNDTTNINNLQQRGGMSCLCPGGQNTLKQRWYYDSVIAKPYTPPGAKRPWYAAIHLGKVKKPTWDEWLAAVSAGRHTGKLVLTCTTCNVTNKTQVANLQRQMMSCLCGKGNRDTLTQRWYYDAVIAKPYTPPGAKRPWYAAIHLGKVKKPTWEEWLAAVSVVGNVGKIVLTCTTCNTTNNTTRVDSLQQGQGMSCACTMKSQRTVFDFVCRIVAEDFPTLSLRVEWEATVRSLGFAGGVPIELEKCRFDIVVVEDVATCVDVAVGDSAGAATKSLARCILESDGIQHFDHHPHFHASPQEVEERAAVDKAKEELAIANGAHVVRLLSADVASDLFDWQGYVRKCLRAALGGVSAPRVWLPDGATDYTRADSAYARAHAGPAAAAPAHAGPAAAAPSDP